LLLQAAIN